MIDSAQLDATAAEAEALARWARSIRGAAKTLLQLRERGDAPGLMIDLARCDLAAKLAAGPGLEPCEVLQPRGALDPATLAELQFALGREVERENVPGILAVAAGLEKLFEKLVKRCEELSQR